MDLGLKGKKALVCGASKGLGYASAEALAMENADVILLGREEITLKEASLKLKKQSSGNISYAVCDLLSEEQRKALLADLKERFGSIDIIIHNVGGPKASAVEDTTLEAWNEGFQRLFLPVVELNHAFLPQMKKQGWGRIITVTSLSVVEPIPMLAVSNAIRSASTAMSKTLSDEVAKFGVTVNCVAPGMIATDRSEELMKARIAKSGQSKEEYEADLKKSIPAARLGRPEEYGAAVCFLCSQQASYITGSTLFVDGGKRRSTY
ncbi:MAG: SDR family oxidoreductase [Candidatus Obscuribacterales bacterium]|nr:SDR family oxidoreductase [Candidatus Obscuribacterales bacterium]